MNHLQKNVLLHTEYEKYHAELSTLFDEETKKTLSQPIFMHVFPKYDSANKKILIVGQETKGWCGNLSDVTISPKMVIDKYESFKLAKTYRYRNSPFWRFNNAFYEKMNPENEPNEWPTGYMWTNLSKVDQNGKGVNYNIRSKNQAGYGLLAREIEITNPDIIVFLTSWKDDETLKTTFGKTTFEKVEDIDFKYLARIKNENLPYNTFRTYHPRFLNNSTRSKYTIGDIVTLIKNSCG